MERRSRRQHEGLPADPAGLADLVRAVVPDNGARQAARRHRSPKPFQPRRSVAALALVAASALSGAGCSLSLPISGAPGVKVDAEPTGSVDRTAALLSPFLDREDLRRARAALAVALDPQGDGGRADWKNPQTGAHGAFAAAAPPFADRDRVCRRFTGDVAPAAGGVRHLSSSACREGDGTWRVLPPEAGRV